MTYSAGEASQTHRCLNCNVKITKVNWALGEQWVHDRAGQGRTSDFYEFCEKQAALPDDYALIERGPNTGIYARVGS